MGLDWQWTNDDHTEARADRWRVAISHTRDLYHDDFRDGKWTLWGSSSRPEDTFVDGRSNETWTALVEVSDVFASFEAWYVNQPAPQPPEPTEFGYVGTVVDSLGDVWDIVRRGYVGRYVAYAREGSWREGVRVNGHSEGLAWSEILALGKFEAVVR